MVHMRRGRMITLTTALSGVLLLAMMTATSASGSPPTAEDQKKQAEAGTGGNVDTGYSSSLDEEKRFAGQAVSDKVSPGAFAEGDQLISRIYADAAPHSGATTLPSRFTRKALEDLQACLTELAGAPGVFFGFSYDAKTDTVVVEGNIPQADLPADAVRAGRISYTYTRDGGRDAWTNVRPTEAVGREPNTTGGWGN